MNKILIFFLFILDLASCKTSHNLIEDIYIDKYKDNYLKVAITVNTTETVDSWITYWKVDSSKKTVFNTIHLNGSHVKHILLNTEPASMYQFTVSCKTNKQEVVTSKIYDFRSPTLPIWLQNQFATVKDSTTTLPQIFKEGFMLLNKRETPGCIYIVDYKGRIRWYHMIDNQGIKVTHFTKDKSIVSIIGRNDEPTSYGSEILEVNLWGDTINYLKKGSGDMNYSFHHEIIKNEKGNYVTLFVDKKIKDLRQKGGLERDTITGDGIVVLNNKGKILWKWSVFDAMDPLLDDNIIMDKKDWMHANSVNYDLDGNFLISFYNNGQIWKIDSNTGKVLWKLGKEGTIKIPSDCQFSQAHAVHKTDENVLMFFNNGIDKKNSEVYGLKIDEKTNSSNLVLHIRLPKDIYNDRMGSVYQVNDSLFLCCSSKRKIAVIVNRKGTILWDMETAVPSYRIEFLKKEDLHPYLNPLL